jgi:nucleoid-associated protein EbfC
MAKGMNPQAIMKQMQKMQADMKKAQEELADETVSASAGGGAVTVTVTGNLEVRSIKIDRSAVDPDDVELLEDTVVAAVNEAMRAAQTLANDRLGGVAGALSGMGLGF